MATYDEIKQRAASRDPERSARTTRWFLLGSIAVTLALYLAPLLSQYFAPIRYVQYVIWPLVWLSTLVHELGHGFTAALLGGEFHRFVMFPDASGAANWSGSFGPVRRAMVAGGGLVGPAIVAAAGFVVARDAKHAQYALMFGVFALSATAVLVVRNAFGWAFVGALIVLLAVLGTRKKPEVAQLGLVFLSTQLAMSVFSRGDYLFMEYADTAQGKMPSDVAQMSEALLAPYWFWGGVCGLFSIVVLGLGLWIFFKGFDGLRLWPERT